MSTIAGNISRVTADLNSRFVLRFLAGLTSGGTEVAFMI